MEEIEYSYTKAHSPQTNDMNALLNAVDRITVGGGTDLYLATEQAANHICNMEALSRSLIILTDGYNNGPGSVESAKQAIENAKAFSFTIGMYEADHQALQSLSSSPRAYNHTPNTPQDLKLTYDNIFNQLCMLPIIPEYIRMVEGPENLTADDFDVTLTQDNFEYSDGSPRSFTQPATPYYYCEDMWSCSEAPFMIPGSTDTTPTFTWKLKDRRGIAAYGIAIFKGGVNNPIYITPSDRPLVAPDYGSYAEFNFLVHIINGESGVYHLAVKPKYYNSQTRSYEDITQSGIFLTTYMYGTPGTLNSGGGIRFND
jgi:hypothetical protein